MLGSQILEVAIGVIFVFILVSIVCTVIREGIEAWLKTRASFLEYGIRELLHDKRAEGIASGFYQHPLIYGLYARKYKPGKPYKRPSAWTSGNNLPSYIPAKNFALALMDIAARGPETDAYSSDASAPRITLEAMRANVTHLGNQAVQRVLLTAIDAAEGDLARVQANLEAWYDSGMDRVSGWYKRSTNWAVFWIGVFVAVSLNINTITIGDYLYRNDTARAAILARAEAAVRDSSFTSASYREARGQIDSLKLPIGWAAGWGAPRPGYDRHRDKFEAWDHLLAPLLGWLLTALAATLGAPFWFDVLNRVMVIRATVKPHEKSPEEASEDRQRQRPPWPYPPSGPVTTGSSPVAGDTTGGNQEHDPEGTLDGCSVVAEVITPDEDLPAAEGGVA